ncbi:MerR family transcriptional regulator [Mycobacterium sp. MHSD3]|uniref:MerR family transcriptional regulator n=1 Tax=Mycobacteroides chelonae TaxID=1774 RepID=UPI0009CBBE5B|nr:MerR family transcriptional regulator [Mycobacteroides chelonae]MBF9523632.1 MerR family transcriptional regulator [Mycobacteroides chelonae]PKQ56755.1 MerR family transcriptional regulator [Mycobacterium sp. MHSD3]SKN26690.1 Putative transcriptional regulator, MerR family [Mycobacteroides abscessus subsp. bolletii]
MDLTIDQLAQRVAMTARNIREWQTLGLVPPPEKRGRVGIYSDDHVAIINHVKNLKSQGFPLDVIRRVIDSGGGSEDSVRKMVIEALSPFATGDPVVMPRAELITRVGKGADVALAELGLVSDVDAKTISVRDCETLDAIELLIAAGMSMSRITETLREVDRLQHQIAQLLLGAYVADVWQPFVESGYASEDWAKIAENASKAKQLTVTLASRLLARALDDTVDPILLQQADEAEAVLERNRPASSA